VIGNIEGEVLAHYGEADEADFGVCVGHNFFEWMRYRKILF
jgi:hypothetical protein